MGLGLEHHLRAAAYDYGVGRTMGNTLYREIEIHQKQFITSAADCYYLLMVYTAAKTLRHALMP